MACMFRLSTYSRIHSGILAVPVGERLGDGEAFLRARERFVEILGTSMRKGVVGQDVAELDCSVVLAGSAASMRRRSAMLS